MPLRILNRPRDNSNDLARDIGSSLSGILQGIGSYNQNLLLEQKKKELGDYLETQDISRDVLNLPTNIQNILLKEKFKQPGFLESFGSWFGGQPSRNQTLLTPPSSMKQQALTQQRPMVPQPEQPQIKEVIQAQVNQMDPSTIQPEIREKLEEVGIEVPLGNGESSIAQNLSSLGTGLATRGLGLRGDLADLGVAAAEYFSPFQMSPERKEQRMGELQEKLKNLSPDSYEAQRAQLALGALQDESLSNLRSYLPSTENIRKQVQQAAKGSALEPFLVPQTDSQKWWQEMGDIAGILSNPISTVKQGALALAKKLATSTLTAMGGDLAKWMTEKATGSELLGNVVKNGMYLMYMLNPGLPQKLAAQKYSEFEQKALEPAVKAGITAKAGKAERAILKQVDNKIRRLVPDSKAYKYLGNEYNALEDLALKNAASPREIYENIKRMNGNYSDVPQQAKPLFKQMVDVQRDMLKKAVSKVDPRAYKLYESANDLFRTSRQIPEEIGKVRDIILPRKLNLGTALFLTGNYKTMLAAGLGGAAAKMVNRALKSPAIRTEITQALKAASGGLGGAFNKHVRNLEKRIKHLDPKVYNQLNNQLQIMQDQS